MTNKKDIFDDNLEKETPLLHSIGKSNPFIVPDGYFDALPSKIMEACRENTKPTVTDKVFWLFRPQWVLISFVLVVSLCLFLRKGDNAPANYEAIVANIPDSVIMQSVQSNINYVDINSLEEMAQTQQNMLPQQPAQDTTSKQIINYLLNNNIDASDIENEL